jgi:hypothetical protein
MSHYSSIATKLRSADHLVKALGDLGLTQVEVHAQPQPLVGWLGDDRVQTAEVIIRQKHVGLGSNDLGFTRDEDGNFRALISDFDSLRYNQSWLAALHQRYAYHASCEQLARQGFDLVNEERDEDGSLRLVLRRMG